MASVLRAPIVVFAFVVDQLRRLPGAGAALRHSGLIAGALIAGAVLAFAVWTATVAPQRVSLADLVQGKLSMLQTWIIVSGDLAPSETRVANYGYVMTDPAVANARMNVYSDVELPLGRTTVSGSFGGPREPTPIGYQWIGTMHADAVTAPELGPPWIAIVLLTGAVLLMLAARTSYPAFFARPPEHPVPRPGQIKVEVRRGTLRSTTVVAEGTLSIRPGEPVTLRTTSGVETIRLHSAYSGVDVGDLAQVGRAQPALRVRLAHDELTLTFDSDADRDAALAALRADAEGWPAAATTVTEGAAT